MIRSACSIAAALLLSCVSCKCEVEADDEYMNDTDIDFFQHDLCVYSTIGEIVHKSSHPATRFFAEQTDSKYAAGWNDLLYVANTHDHYPDSCVIIHSRTIRYLATLNGHSFDSSYLSEERQRHQGTLRLFRKVLDHGSNNMLRDYVSNYLPVVEKNFKIIDSLVLLIN